MKAKLQIGPYFWDFDDSSADLEENSLGECQYEKLTIKIRDDITQKDIKTCTVIHELLHAAIVSSGMEIQNEENTIDVLANQILFFIKNNKEFLKDYLFVE